MKIYELLKKQELLAIGLMSGTSADGVDAVLVKIRGCGIQTKVTQLAFINEPFSDEIHELILKTASGNYGGSAGISQLNFLLGHLFSNACNKLCKQAGVLTSDIELIGSHGLTVYHQPEAVDYHGVMCASTLQIGEPSVLAELCPQAVIVSDFRVRDLAAGGLGAPLVPYSEYLLYREEKRCIALQNLGGIGNITILPPGASFEEVTAFDTGPGNMLMDACITCFTRGAQHYDYQGKMAAKGIIQENFLNWLLEDPYIKQQPPKTTGREYYGQTYVTRLLEYAHTNGYSPEDVMATVTMFTARTVEFAIRHLCACTPQVLILGGGGAYNDSLVRDLKTCLAEIEVTTNEALGFSSDAKEAIAFAILANETVRQHENNVPSVTGARHPVVMGKITW